MQQLKRLSERQQVAVKSPYDSSTNTGMTFDHQGDIGHWDSLLTVDIRTLQPDVAFSDRYEWHASVCLDAAIITLPNQEQKFPFVPMFSWTREVWDDAIQYCKDMIGDVGEAEGAYWMGEGFSLHYRRPLRQREMALVLELMK